MLFWLVSLFILSSYGLPDRMGRNQMGRNRIYSGTTILDNVPIDSERDSMIWETTWISNQKYTNDYSIFGKAKCIMCGNFVGASPEQIANQYPDKYAVHFVANFILQIGWNLSITSQYPHARYFSYTVANELGNGQLGGGVFLNGEQIIPDSGSQNPFWSNETRNVTNRNYTIYIVHGKEPKVVPPNTLYTGTMLKNNRVHLALRVYLVDEGYDFTGNVKLYDSGNGMPEVTLNLPDKTITGPELLNILQVIKISDPPEYPLKQWLTEIEQSKDKINAPAFPIPVAELFWDMGYSISGLFLATHPEQRVQQYPPSNEGGFLNNPNTAYLTIPYSFGFGEVLIIQGRLPSHPFTRKGENKLPNNTDVQYFSISTSAGPFSGESYDSVYDEQIPIDKFGNYLIVISWKWNRPSNSLLKNGIVWLNPGAGEGHYVTARIWTGVVVIRFQNCNPKWPESPTNVPIPTVENPIPQEPFVMKDYYPRGVYMSKSEFEILF